MSTEGLQPYKNLDLSRTVNLEEALQTIVALPAISVFDIALPYDGLYSPAAPIEEALAARLQCDEELPGYRYKSFRPDSILNGLRKAYKIATDPELVIARVNLSQELPQVEYLMPHNTDGYRNKSVSISTRYAAKRKKIGRGEERRSMFIDYKTTPKVVDISEEPYAFYVKPTPTVDAPTTGAQRILNASIRQGRTSGTGH